MSQLAKLLLVATSLAPALGAFALIQWQKGDWSDSIIFLVVGALLVFICCMLILYVKQHGERERLSIKTVETMDKDSLAYLIAYLFPLFTGKFPSLSEHDYWLPTIYVLAIIALTVYHSNAFHFNPVLAVFGYHFYQVTTTTDMKYMLITREVIRQQHSEIEVVELSNYVFLQTGTIATESSPGE